jgi:KDO2-lipid IV(A) lauroyltransferase
VSEPFPRATEVAAPAHRAAERRGWTRHGLNTGVIFNATCRGVSLLPRSVSYAIGHAGTWLAWRLMPRTRGAVADNLRALFPDAGPRELSLHALRTLRAYATDVIDFLRALEATDAEARALFETRPEDGQLFRDLLAQGRGIILVTGHYGNWEIGSVFMRRVFPLPLTVVAMPEVSEEVNRTRRSIRDALGVQTIEVRQALDTALQIRRRLGENGIVAMLMDRHVGRDRVEVSLLGRRAWFLRTPALMASLTGAPLVPCFIERVGPARFRVQPGEPILVAGRDDREAAIRRAAQQFADQLGARIRRSPHHWYQFYPYWQTQLEDV